MEAFWDWFIEFMTQMLGGVWKIFEGLFLGIVQIFNFGTYANQLTNREFGWTWILVILTILIAIAIWVGLVFLIILAVRKYIRFRRTIVGNEDLLEEIADLHRDVLRLTSEKERILNMKISQTGLSMEEIRAALGEEQLPEIQSTEETEETEAAATEETAQSSNNHTKRFARLSAVDEKYVYYQPPVYNKEMDLKELCDDIRNFACYHSRLFYEIKTIRLMVAGLSSTKLIVLQGISGTGKTSLPYNPPGEKEVSFSGTSTSLPRSLTKRKF